MNSREAEIWRLKAGFLNATLLFKHMMIFRQFLSTTRSSYHFFGVVESRFAQKVDDVFAQINGFSVLRQDRNRRGGGIALYIRNDYKASILCSSLTETVGKPGTPEYLVCKIQQGKLSPIFVAVIYSPLDVSYDTLILT